VTLNAPEMWEDAKRLLDYGFRNYTREKLIEEGQVLKKVELDRAKEDYGSVVSSSDFYFPLKEGEKDKIRYLFRLEEPVVAPVKAGEKIGELEMRLQGERMGTVDITVEKDIERSPFYYFFIRLWRKYFS